MLKIYAVLMWLIIAAMLISGSIFTTIIYGDSTGAFIATLLGLAIGIGALSRVLGKADDD